MPTLTATPKQFSMQQAFEVLLQKPADKSILAYLTNCKTSGLENTMEMVYPTGARGNVYIGGGFGHSRRASFNISVATWNTDVLAQQNGTTVYTGSTSINYYDTFKATVGGTVGTPTYSWATKFTAQGTAGSEIGFLYPINNDGTYGTPYTQVASVTAAGTFAYSSATKAVTFFAGDEPDSDTYLACAYEFNSGTNAQTITINADGIPPVVLCTAYGLARDICTGELFPCTINGQAQVDGNWNFDLAADGEPAVHNLSMEFVKSCISKKLYDFKVFTENEAIV